MNFSIVSKAIHHLKEEARDKVPLHVDRDLKRPSHLNLRVKAPFSGVEQIA